MAKLTTFVHDPTHIEALIQAGIEHLILEDPQISIRSFSQTLPTDFKSLLTLADTARSLNPDIKLSINCDMLAHERHFPVLNQLISAIKPTPLRHIRVQDPGLLCFFQDQLADVSCHLNLETGNHTATGMLSYAHYCDSQTVSNEVPYPDLQNIRKHCLFPLEIYVFGPLLIQYSVRRFLEGTAAVTPNDTHHRYIKYAQDTQFPGRYFKFYDNEHGHFMFAFFDRCLLKEIDKLKQLKMNYWLFDGRGESLDYLLTALNAFQNPSQFPIKDLQHNYPRPLKLGFFRANHTDQVHIAKPHMRKDHLTCVGTVVDLIKPNTITIECHQNIQVGDTLTVVSPRYNDHTLTITVLQTLENESISDSQDHIYVQIPWYKGARNGSQLYR